MADEELREAERRWRASGAAEEEVRLLAVRLRAGALGRARVELAAALGDPAAQGVWRELGGLEAPAELSEAGKAAWLRLHAHLERAPRLDWTGVDLETAMRASLALLEGAVDDWARLLEHRAGLRRPAPPEAVVEVVRGGVVGHVRDALQACRERLAGRASDDEALAGHALRLAAASEAAWRDDTSGGEHQLRSFLAAFVTLPGDLCRAFLMPPRDPAELAKGVDFGVTHWLDARDRVERARRRRREQVAPWLLGHSDPLRP